MQIVSRAEAIAEGKTRFFTGKSCRNGHVCERYISTAPAGSCIECVRKGQARTFAVVKAEELKGALKSGSKSTFVYVLATDAGTKIGITTDMHRRLKVTRTCCPLPVTLAFVTDGMPWALAQKIENICKTQFAAKLIHGEWFAIAADEAVLAVKHAEFFL